MARNLEERAEATCDEPVKVHFNEFVMSRGMTTANTGTDGLYFAINLSIEIMVSQSFKALRVFLKLRGGFRIGLIAKGYRITCRNNERIVYTTTKVLYIQFLWDIIFDVYLRLMQ